MVECIQELATGRSDLSFLNCKIMITSALNFTVAPISERRAEVLLLCRRGGTFLLAESGLAVQKTSSTQLPFL